MGKKSTSATVMFISAMLIYGTIGIFRRYIPLPSSLLACLRGFMGAAFLLIFIKVRGGTIRHGIGRKNLMLLLLNGGIMGFNWVFLFEAYNYTSVAVATLCYYMEPTLLILLSPLVFRERLTGIKVICAIISLIGMVFVSGILSGQSLQQSDLHGVGYGLAAAAFYTIVVILNKKITVDDAYEKTILQLLGAAVILVPYVMATEDLSTVTLNGLAVFMILILGIVHTGIAYALYFGSMQAMKAQSIAVLSYIDPVSALLLSALFLGETLSVYGIIGAVLIIGAAIFSELNVSKKAAATAE